MTNHAPSGDKGATAVDQAVAGMKRLDIPAGPTEALVRETLARVRSVGEKDAANAARRNWWTMRTVRRSAIAAGFGILATVGILWLVWGRGAGVAFADVIEQVRKVQAVRCKIAAELKNAPAGTAPAKMEMLMAEPGWVVTTLPSMKIVMNRSEGKMMMLWAERKEAMVLDWAKAPANVQTPSVLEAFKKIQGKENKPLGAKEIDGHKTTGFLASENGMEMEVWADVQTQLPVLVKMTMVNGMMASGTYTFSDFDWNPAVDAKELSFELPAGYTQSTTTMDGSAPSEADVVKMLEVAAEINGGTLPDGLGMQQVTKNVANWMKSKGMNTRGAPNAELRGKLMELMMPVGRGMAYMGASQKGAEWRYGGKGVKLGEKGVPVLWYKMSGTDGWRVFDADMTIHDAKDGEVPTGELVKTQMGFGGPAETRAAPKQVEDLPVQPVMPQP